MLNRKKKHTKPLIYNEISKKSQITSTNIALNSWPTYTNTNPISTIINYHLVGLSWPEIFLLLLLIKDNEKILQFKFVYTYHYHQIINSF